MNWLIAYGVRRFFSGARMGQPAMAGLGAALGLIGWLRSRSDPRAELVYRRVLKEGETVRVRLVSDRTVVDDTGIED